MAQKSGRTLLLKLEDSVTPGTFNNICGVATRNFTINNNIVDTTTPNCDSPGSTVKYTGDYGIQTLTFSGDGRFTDDAKHVALADISRQQTPTNGQVVVPGWGTFEGALLVGSYELGGETEGTMTFSASFTMSGDITFTAEV